MSYEPNDHHGETDGKDGMGLSPVGIIAIVLGLFLAAGLMGWVHADRTIAASDDPPPRVVTIRERPPAPPPVPAPYRSSNIR